MDGLEAHFKNQNSFYKIVQQTQRVVAGAFPAVEPTCIVAPVAAVRRFSLQESRNKFPYGNYKSNFTRDFVTISMIDKNEDHLNDKQHVSFRNNIKLKLKFFVLNFIN
jgi:hypothetical protein